MKKAAKRVAAFLLSLLLMSLFPCERAWAGEPPVQERRGIAAEESLWLDESLYSDGSDFENEAWSVKTVRIGVLHAGNSSQDLSFISPYGFRLGYYDTVRNFVETHVLQQTHVVFSCSAGVGLQVLDGESGEELYRGSGANWLGIVPISGYIILGGDTFKGGFDCRVNDQGMITAVSVIDLEEYVKGVVPYEMNPNWPLEALKAQAVCARTYVVYHQGEYADLGFDITADQECQVYRGVGWTNSVTDEAVDCTRGQLLYWRGGICSVYYASSNGGASEDGTNVFPQADRPYLKGKLDPFDTMEEYEMKEWTVTRSSSAVGVCMTNLDPSLRPGAIQEVTAQRSRTGNVIAMEFLDDSGERFLLEGRKCYTFLGLYSCRFEIVPVDGGYDFVGSGLGHSCGMSQYGAKAMAERFDYDYEQILRFYYTGAYIA